jgi:hypothetical protein
MHLRHPVVEPVIDNKSVKRIPDIIKDAAANGAIERFSVECTAEGIAD